MSTNVKLLEKGIKNILILLSLLIISPTVLSLGYKGLKAFDNSNKIYIAYFLLVLGAVLTILTLFQGFKTFKIILKCIFND